MFWFEEAEPGDGEGVGAREAAYCGVVEAVAEQEIAGVVIIMFVCN